VDVGSIGRTTYKLLSCDCVRVASQDPEEELAASNLPTRHRRDINLEQALETKEFPSEERNSYKREKHSERGWEGEGEGNQKVCPPPQACTQEMTSGERREVFSFLEKFPC
jgi:hypothetical protein